MRLKKRKHPKVKEEIFINILICGASSAFTLRLISRLNQDRHEIFVLTGSELEPGKRTQGVLQEYYFHYTSNSVVRIIQNVKPDLVIFTGALDERFQWKGDIQQSSEFIAGLTNIVISAVNADVKRFIYCSSVDVTANLADTQENSGILDHRMKTLIQGEQTCAHYNKPDVFEVNIMRFSELYGNFDGKNVRDSICTALFEAVSANEVITIKPNKRHQLLFVDDAADALYRLVKKQDEIMTPVHVIGEYRNEQEIVQNMLQRMNVSGRINEAEDIDAKIVLPSELNVLPDFQLKYKFDDGLAKFLLAAEKDHKKGIMKQRFAEGFFGSKISALLETIVMVVVAGLLTTVSQNTILDGNFDFYMVAVVLISIVHGSIFGVLSVILSVLMKYSGYIQTYGIYSLVTNYAEYLWMLQLLIIGAVVSFIRDKYRRKDTEYREENKYISNELKHMIEINDSNVYVKNVFEQRLINYKDSLAKIYDITSTLDQLSTSKVIFEAAGVIKQLMNVEDVAVYFSGDNSSYLRLMASTSAEARKLGKSLYVDETHVFYEGIKNEGYYRNTQLDEAFPILAGAIMEDKRISILILIWDLKIEGANLYHANLLAILCKLIEKSMKQAQTYMNAIKHDTFLEGSRALNSDAFTQILAIYNEGKEKHLLDFSVIQITSNTKSFHDLVKVTEANLRLSDYFGVGTDGNLYALLTNSNEEDVSFVIDRFKKLDVQCSISNE